MTLGPEEIDAIRGTRSYRSALWNYRGAAVLVPLVFLSGTNTMIVNESGDGFLPAEVADFLSSAQVLFSVLAFVMAATSFYLLDRAGVEFERSRRRSDPFRRTIKDPLVKSAIGRDVLFLDGSPRKRRTPPAAG